MLGKVLFITAIAGVGGTGAGGLAACLFRRDSSRTVSLLLSFAAGVMTAVVCFDLLADAVQPQSTGERTGLLWVVCGVLMGYAGVCLLNLWADRRMARCGNGRGRLFLAGLVMAAAIALHNVPEGMVVGASFAKSAGEMRLSRGGLLMALVIGLHNVPEGMAVAVPLMSGGMGRAKAVWMTAVTGAPTVLGAAGGYFLGTLGPRALALALSGASGAMLYVVFGELLPESVRMWESKAPALAAVIGIITGLIIVYA